ncbi:MAG: hypothetical protein MR224_06430 [Dorea sp.]|nr:hypothetical protein [Dorea sp.]MDY2814797.1 hypothetical protein [Dorea sp.]
MMADGGRKKEYERKKEREEERYRADGWSDSGMVKKLIRLIHQEEKAEGES